nr:MAG TPA: BssS protein family protein [Caudoviricetes sp.]
MNNQDRAAKAIKFAAARGYTPEQIATLLNELNLLAPDLPEPSPGTDGALIWHNGEVWLEDNDTDVYTDLHSPFDWMTTDQARNLAHALLAAANYTEEE